MALPKAFDRDDVLDKATQVFWLKGYEATSIQDLVEATGINRGSLYNTFTDKAGLFGAVLGRYTDRSSARALVANAEAGPPRATIEAFFADLVDIGAADPERRGCLLTNTAVENAFRKGLTRPSAGSRAVRTTRADRRGKRGRTRPPTPPPRPPAWSARRPPSRARRHAPAPPP